MSLARFRYKKRKRSKVPGGSGEHPILSPAILPYFMCRGSVQDGHPHRPPPSEISFSAARKAAATAEAEQAALLASLAPQPGGNRAHQDKISKAMHSLSRGGQSKALKGMDKATQKAIRARLAESTTVKR